MTDDTIVGDLTVLQLKEIIKDVPKTYFSAACKAAHKNCQTNWNTDMHEFALQ
ncbi:unnamed protein product [marine sediment metagenome]|uniref:Uncharacterized protein n=1 Tax=marine sediment metagenome TaxID=412755 RepID=X1DKR7_9ZZZZ